MGISAQHSGGSSALPTGPFSRARRSVRTGIVRSVIPAVLFALLVTVSASPAAAAPTPTPSPAPTSTPPEPVTLTSPAADEFVGSVPLTVTGTKAAGAAVQLHTGDSGNPVCLVPSSEDTTFTCVVDSLPQGARISLTAVQLLDGADSSTASTSIRVLLPPVIAPAPNGPSNGFLSGTGFPGASLTLRGADGRTWPVTVPASGSWGYVLPLDVPSGSLTVTATQSTPFSGPGGSAPSAPVRLLLDRSPPAAPSITSPVAGRSIPAGTTTYAGTGETGASVTVFAVTASGIDIELCSAVPVSSGRWSCTGAAVPAGDATLTAYQRDQAGNTGPGSPAFTVSFTAPAPSASTAPSTVPTEGQSPAPVVPPAPSAPPPAAEPLPDTAPAPDGPWAQQTPFTAAVQSAVGPGADLAWLRAVLLAIAAIVFLLVPARMVATSVGHGRSFSTNFARPALTGRNKTPTHDDPPPLLSAPGTLARMIIGLCVAGGIVLFARPVDGQPAYLRVFVASVLALVLINAAATWVPARYAAWRTFGSPVQRLSFVAFPVVLAVALLSRTLDLQPALLFGLLVVIALPEGTARDRGELALSRIAAVFVLGLVAWFATTMMGTPGGFAGLFAVELVNITAMAALGSAALMMVPLGKLSGRAVLNWSRPAWFVSALLIFTVLFAFLSPTVDAWEGQVALVVAALAAVGFGAIGISLWIWRRMVAPNLTPS